MTLAEYLSRTGTSASAFADAIGMTQATVSRYLSGARFPDKDTILKIETVTNKKVRPADWFEERVA